MKNINQTTFDNIDTQALWQKDKNHHLHAWSDLQTFESEGALMIAEGDGCYLYDTDGKKYLDSVGGLWCNNIGLGRADMAEAIAEQVKQLSFNSNFNDLGSIPAANLAEKLAQLAPGNLNRVHFTTGGSTAVDTAFRLVQLYHYSRGNASKKHIISRKEAYHGSTYMGSSLGGKAGDRLPAYTYLSDIVHHISCPYFYRAPEGMTESDYLDFLVKELEDKILSIGADNVAAFFAEPILGAGGVIVPPKGYHQRTWEICKKYDLLYVSDEVVTAFGRLGHWFTSEDEFGIVPDIITTAKGLSSGYLPLGATIFSDEIYDAISAPDSDVWMAHGFTYAGHPVCCAAGLKNIEIMEQEGILDHVKEIGPYFEQQLDTLLDLSIVGDRRGSHLMQCVELVADKASKTNFPKELNIGKWVHRHADKKGLIIRPVANFTIMSPPLIITRKEVDFVVKTLRESIEATMAELREKSMWQG
ncbi:MAG: aminotransferase [Deltaproteobacteria bacterium]|nr:aminotransferase [Deltaproteobacteria bacterium]